MLAHLSQAKAWGRVKQHALRGWQLADDHRLYHPIVAEKVLEAWLEKLAQRLSSGAGNAKRWGVEFDPSPIERDMKEARGILSSLNPQSRTLTKRRTSGVPSGSKNDIIGTPKVISSGVPSGSQETGTGTGIKEQEQGANAPLSPAAADDADVREAEGAEPIPDCPHGAILDLFADKLPELPQPRRSLWSSSKNAEALRSRWRWVLTSRHESGPRKGQRLAECEADAVAWFGRFFEYVGKCPLLMGDKGEWRAELGWLVKRENFAKVIQGNYERQEAA